MTVDTRYVTLGGLAEPFHEEYRRADEVQKGDVLALDWSPWLFAEVMFAYVETVERSGVKVVRWQLAPWPRSKPSGDVFFAVRGWHEPMKVLARDA